MKEANKKGMRRIITNIMVILMITMLLELFVFNIRFFQTMFYDEKIVDENYSLSIENGHLLSDGSIELDDTADYLYITFTDLNIPIENVRLDIELPDEEITDAYIDHVCDVLVLLPDNALYAKPEDDDRLNKDSGMYELTEKKIIHSISSSHYIWIQSNDAIHEIRFKISSLSGVGRIFKINDITFNAVYKPEFIPIRIICIFFLLLLIYAVLFEKNIWEADCTNHTKWKVMLPVVLFILIAIISYAWAVLNVNNLSRAGINEYAPLAKALVNGETSVGEAGDFVKNMEGKITFWNMQSSEVKFDYAYYNGKYYVYFGILPCVVFFIPYYLLTGKDLPNYIPMVFLCLTLMAEEYIFLGMLIRRYYKKTPYIARLLMTAAACAGMNLPLFISIPDHYMIPIAFGVVLLFAGAMCYLKGMTDTFNRAKIFPCENEIKESSFIKLPSVFWIALGNICLAAVSLCRPTLLIPGFSLISVLLIAHFRDISSMSHRYRLQYVMAVVIPYITCAGICMYYNYIRFDSPFDFGASRNMTSIPLNGGDGFLPYQIQKLLHEYLFESAVFKPEFPYFLNDNRWELVSEGASLLAIPKSDIGLFTATPVLWAGILFFAYRKSLKKKKLYYPICAMAISGFVVMVFSTRFTSFITERYTMEFSPILFALAFIGLMELNEDFKKSKPTTLSRSVLIFIRTLLLAATLYGFLQILPDKGEYSLFYGNTELYYRIYYAANFML